MMKNYYEFVKEHDRIDNEIRYWRSKALYAKDAFDKNYFNNNAFYYETKMKSLERDNRDYMDKLMNSRV